MLTQGQEAISLIGLCSHSHSHSHSNQVQLMGRPQLARLHLMMMSNSITLMTSAMCQLPLLLHLLPLSNPFHSQPRHPPPLHWPAALARRGQGHEQMSTMIKMSTLTNNTCSKQANMRVSSHRLTQVPAVLLFQIIHRPNLRPILQNLPPHCYPFPLP